MRTESISIGVLICLYKGDSPDLFEGAIESILNQDIRDVALRIYLGIDGPIGEALESTVTRLAPKLYRIERSPTNRGLAATLNSLILQRSDEKYLFRMDADDRCHPQRFSRQLWLLEQAGSADIVGTDIREIDADGNFRVVSFGKGPHNDVSRLAKRVPVAHPTVCFKASVFDTVSQYPDVRGNEDVAMWFRCAAAGLTFDNVPEPLLDFRVDPGFWKRRSWRKAATEFRSYMAGIWSMKPCSLLYIYPILRLLMRLAPTRLSKFLYAARIGRS